MTLQDDRRRGPTTELNIQPDPGRITQVLLGVVTLLTTADLAVLLFKTWGHERLLGFSALFNTNWEGNVPTYYSALTLLACALLLGAIAQTTRRTHDRFATHWLVLAVLFLYLSFDEACQFHEMRLFKLLATGVVHPTGVFYYAWVVPYTAALVVFALAFRRFVMALPGPTRSGFLIAGTVFVLGAVGMESLTGFYDERFGSDTLVYEAFTTLEELLEMVAIVVLIRTLLAHSQLRLVLRLSIPTP